MTQLILRIYDYLAVHRHVRRGMLVLLTAGMIALLLRISFQEDISAFLPLSKQYGEMMDAYRQTSGADRVIVIAESKPIEKSSAYEASSASDSMVAAIDCFASLLAERDTAHMATAVTSQIDIDEASSAIDYVSSNLPLYLQREDYQRIDTLLLRPNYISQRLSDVKEQLMASGTDIETDILTRDPLLLFSPALERLRKNVPTASYEIYDNHFFSKDMRQAYLIMTSTFGASETNGNAALVDMLNGIAHDTEQHVGGVKLHITGGPVIAVGNASRIKADSLIAIAVALVLIIALMAMTLHRLRNIALIIIAITWGWLGAMGGLSVVHSEVSLIVIGIASVILGIAVNYPLHVIAHTMHTTDMRQALSEIVSPLVVGNITTVGAFVALIPLQSSALRDLGIFASLLLLFTIIFSIIFLPHLIKPDTTSRSPRWLERLASVQLESKPWVVAVVVVLTIVLGWFSLGTSFDSNFAHINYMTTEQRADMQRIERMQKGSRQTTVYALSSAPTLDEALSKQRSAATLVSTKEQKTRLKLWNDFTAKHAAMLKAELKAEGSKQGFAPDAFDAFYETLGAVYHPIAPEAMLRDTKDIAAPHVIRTASGYDIITSVNVDSTQVSKTIASLERQGLSAFTVAQLNSQVANNMSDDFNYIGWACSAVVFFFLWFSMRSIKLATISFIPMAVSWLWILGIMDLMGLQFNVVNIILATFIFGQGDDYTIFITEGCIYEYKTGRRMLASYKQSIIISALIMFIGIGTLVLARHPALHSLGVITIVGMFSVVLMAWLIPPFLFRLLIKYDKRFRDSL